MSLGLPSYKNQEHTLPEKQTKRKIGVLFSGGPASGGHAVIYGLMESWQHHGEVLGFLGGADGLMNNHVMHLDLEQVRKFALTGGFHLLGTGRKKIETEEDFFKCLQVIDQHHLDGVVFIGGDDTHTNAYHLGKYLEKMGSKTSMIAVPKTIDGDVKSKHILQSFGFDTATRVYSEMIGNLGMDLLSTKKYWHFVRLMGRKASHVTLECALQTKPNWAFISEEVAEKNMSLQQIIDHLVNMMIERKKAGKPYGLVLIPEGLIEFIGEMKELLEELNALVEKGKGFEQLSEKTKVTFSLLPEQFQKMLFLDRDSHGNIRLSQIATEELLGSMVLKELEKRKEKENIAILYHFYGYEGRCSVPSDFDLVYCYNLGLAAAHLIEEKKSLCVASLLHLHLPPEKWQPIGAPIEENMTEEKRKGKTKFVVKKALVDLDGPAFHFYQHHRLRWKMSDEYTSIGPMQKGHVDAPLLTKTLALELGSVEN